MPEACVLTGSVLKECLELVPWLEFLSRARLVCKAWHQVAWSGRYYCCRVYVKNAATERDLTRDILHASGVLSRLPQDRSQDETHTAMARFVEAVHVRGLCCSRTLSHLEDLSKQADRPETKLDLLIAADPKGCCASGTSTRTSARKTLSGSMLRVVDSIPDSQALRKFRCHERIMPSMGSFVIELERYFAKAATLARDLHSRSEIGPSDLGLFLVAIADTYQWMAYRNTARRYFSEALPLLTTALSRQASEAVLLAYEEACFRRREFLDDWSFLWNVGVCLPSTIEGRALRADLLSEVRQVSIEVLGAEDAVTLRATRLLTL